MCVYVDWLVIGKLYCLIDTCEETAVCVHVKTPQRIPNSVSQHSHELFLSNDHNHGLLAIVSGAFY